MATQKYERQSSHILPSPSIELHEVIGTGGHAQVWSATYTNKLGEKIKVAAKKVLSESIDSPEIKVMQKTEHKNIIKFYGVWNPNAQDVYIIMEHAERGDLRLFLNECRQNKQRLTRQCMWKWIYEASCALQYFSTLKLSHRDVKSLNFLIMDDYTLKLGDMGLTTPLETTQKTQGKGTCRWMAPEVSSKQLRSPKSDIFSFGIVIWEIVTMGIPYAAYRGNYHVMKAVCDGERPKIPEDCPDVLRSLMTRCWAADRNERPDIGDVCHDLLQYQCPVRAFVEPDSEGSRRFDEDTALDIEMPTVSPLSSSGTTTLPASPHLQQDAGCELSGTLGEDAEMTALSTRSGSEIPMEVGDELSGELQLETQEFQGAVSRPRQPVQKSSSVLAAPGVSLHVQNYHMKNKPHGICIIINNMDFSEARKMKDPNFKDRRGSEVDAEKLQRLFEGLHYEVEIHNDLTKSAMYYILESKRKTDHSKSDCFICCILSHGANSKLYGCDGKSIPILTLTQLFTADICETLSGKPKLFIFESCLGHDKQGATLEHDGLTQRETIPNDSDFILGYATVPGHIAYRHTVEGSWYINSLVETISTSGTKYDILTLLTMVNKDLSGREDDEGNKQTASVFNTLRKNMYLCENAGAPTLHTI